MDTTTTIQPADRPLWEEFGIDPAELEGWRLTLVRRGKEIVLFGTFAGTAILFTMGSTLVANAVVLGSVTTIGGILLYLRLPSWLKRLIMRFSVVADVGAAILTYFVFGETATALLAAGIVGCMTSAILWFASQLPQDGCQPILVDE